MPYIPDNYDLWEEHEAEQSRQLDKMPECSYCGEKIQDDFCYEINDEIICEECLNTIFRKAVDDLVQ
jgi:formylmethanofuran dehydrogenase subunit E